MKEREKERNKQKRWQISDRYAHTKQGVCTLRPRYSNVGQGHCGGIGVGGGGGVDPVVAVEEHRVPCDGQAGQANKTTKGRGQALRDGGKIVK